MITSAGFATTDQFGWIEDRPKPIRRRLWYVYKIIQLEAPVEIGPKKGKLHLTYVRNHQTLRRHINARVLIGGVKSATHRGAKNLAAICWPDYRIIVVAHKLPERDHVGHSESR